MLSMPPEDITSLPKVITLFHTHNGQLTIAIPQSREILVDVGLFRVKSG